MEKQNFFENIDHPQYIFLKQLFLHRSPPFIDKMSARIQECKNLRIQDSKIAITENFIMRESRKCQQEALKNANTNSETTLTSSMYFYIFLRNTS